MSLATRQALSPRPRHDLAIVAAAILTPLGHLIYLAALFWFRGHPPINFFEPFFDLPQYLLTIALTGVIVYLDWNWELRIAPIAAIGALLVWPTLFTAPIGHADHGWLPFAVVLLATGVEGILRFPERVQQFTAGRTGRHALAVGSLHFAVGFSLQVYTRRFFWMDWTGVIGKSLMLFSYIYAGLALVAAGALVVILWRQFRLVGPALATSGWFLWGLYGLWQLRDSLPLSNFVGIDWFYPIPHPDYMLKGTVLLFVLLAVAGGELTVRRARRYIDGRAGNSAS